MTVVFSSALLIIQCLSTMYCGYECAANRGLFLAGVCFTAVFTGVFKGILVYLYVEYWEVSTIAPFLYGFKPAVIAIIVEAIYKLGVKVLKN